MASNSPSYLDTNPSELIKYVNEYVKVKVKSTGKEREGWLYTIDPISMSLVLINLVGEKKEATIVFGDEVGKIQIIERQNNVDEIDLNNLFRKSTGKVKQASSSNDHFEKLVEYLRKNHLPIKLSRDESQKKTVINILDSVLIRWPYSADDCESTNEIILDKVRKLISTFENDQNKEN